ncbi:guanylate kinase [Pseudomonadota bacterium]
MKKGLLLTISGPSGVGKGTIIRKLKKKYPDFVFPVSSTTREKREKEVEGEVYNFISKKEFEEGIEKGDFLEYAQVHEQDYYGTPRKPIMDALEAGEVVIREVDIQGAHSIMKEVPDENLVSIFIRAESAEKLIGRIFKRGKLPEEEMERRMESMEREMADIESFDYVVWNYEGQLADCMKEVEDIVEKETKEADLKIDAE